MKLVAEILTGSSFDVEIGEDATIQDLKKAIEAQENLPTGRLILMLDFDGEHYLLDEEKLNIKDYGIQDGSRIYIFFQPLNETEPSTSPYDSESKKYPATSPVSTGFKSQE